MSFFFFFFNDTATTEIYTLSLHDALPILAGRVRRSDQSIVRRQQGSLACPFVQRSVFDAFSKGQRHGRSGAAGRSEEHTSELQSHLNLVCRLLLEKKKKKRMNNDNIY